MNQRKSLVNQRIKHLREVLDKISQHSSLKRDITNIDKLAKKVSETTGIGYSTLLKKGGNYRHHLEATLIKIIPKSASLVSFEDKMPENWVHQKAIYESEIGLLKQELKKAEKSLDQARLAIAHASDHRLTIDDANKHRDMDIKVEKLCRVLATLLDYLAEEQLGIELDVKTGTIVSYGETLMTSELLAPYIEWQKRTSPKSGD
ncbi:hypothetical protein [Vibrio viridaestus]|uniref:Uncharacterized protein n=1 Tax=Vibrio viridaestus TaxID=2487322 RepID=A0A3N9U2C3_9VIBR|nr:hypothetical protein [Vibrio viridaestus]RQW62076.1 hypothetical protein EES38_15255 [Vibrio viridaestus]